MHAINNKQDVAARQIILAILIVLAILLGATRNARAASGTPTVPVKPVAIISVDDDARGLSYPSAVFFDRTEEEIYLINGGTSRVVIYGPDFFPRVSIGTGRSVAYPRGIYVTNNGQVYISQAVNRANPVRRITVLNGAFFVDREIFLDEIPETAGISPGPLAVSRDGNIYLTSDKIRGVLVLDKEGGFLRWLKPLDMISDRKAIAEAAEQETSAEGGVDEIPAPIEVEDADGEVVEGSLADIPEEFRPRSEEDDAGEPSGPGLGPVKIHNLTIDSVGNIYLLSSETSKVYVYSPDETFLYSFGKKGGTPRSMSQPRSLAIDEKNEVIYIVDYARHTVIAYDMAGEFLFEIGGRGFKPGFFNFPVSIAVNRHSQIIVADLFNKRVQVLDVDYKGRFQVIEDESPADAGVEGEAIAEGEAQDDSSDSTAESEESAVEEVTLPADAIPTPPESGPEAAEEQGPAGGADGQVPAASSATDGAAVEDVTKPETK